jgi:outer membrane protein TolC
MLLLFRRLESRRPRAASALSWTLVMFAASACSSPARLSIDDAQVAAAVTARQSVEDVERGLELADLGPLSIPIPPPPSEVRPDQAEFWQACAFAWNAELRQLRRRVRELRALSRSAGKPTPLMGQGMMLDFEDPDAELEAQLMLDVFGLLGIGPAAAARELARAEVRAAVAALEARAWSLRFDVDRARVELAAARALETAMGGLYSDAAQMLPRIEILARRGWIGAGMSEGALAALHMVEHPQTMARADVARMRAELADLCGLDAAHGAFDDFQGGVIDRFRPDDVEWNIPTTQELLGTLPELRAMKLELALAEAELQREARERWPMLRVGPRVVAMPDDTFLGPMFGIDIPFPGALEGRIAAAGERRDAALEALEDGLVAARTRLDRAQRVWEETLALRDEHAPETDRSVARMLASARAEFLVDPERLERWSLALTERIASLTAVVRARADLVLAWLDWQEACGAREVAEVQP